MRSEILHKYILASQHVEDYCKKYAGTELFFFFILSFFLANGVAIREACYFVLGTVNNISKRNSQCLTVPQCYTSSDTAVVSKQAEANLLSI